MTNNIPNSDTLLIFKPEVPALGLLYPPSFFRPVPNWIPTYIMPVSGFYISNLNSLGIIWESFRNSLEILWGCVVGVLIWNQIKLLKEFQKNLRCPLNFPTSILIKIIEEFCSQLYFQTEFYKLLKFPSRA